MTLRGLAASAPAGSAATDRSLVADVTHVLVCLAWLGELSKEHIRRLCMPHARPRTVGAMLQELLQEGYVVKRQWALPRQRGGPPERQLAMWSLSRKGQQSIRDDPLYPRELAKVRARRILPHDAMSTEALVCMIEAGRKVGLSSIWLEHEVRLDPARSRPVMDAFIVIRTGGIAAEPDWVPWTLDPRTGEEKSGRLALENDRGTEGRREIEGKAVSYQAAGTPAWLAKYGAFPIPTWVVPSMSRLRSILAWWAPMWPQGRWFMTTDQWIGGDRWIEFQGGQVCARGLFRTPGAPAPTWLPVADWLALPSALD